MIFGSLNVEEKRIWKPDNISIGSSQENRLIKGVVQSWVMPVLTEKDIHRKILHSEIKKCRIYMTWEKVIPGTHDANVNKRIKC